MGIRMSQARSPDTWRALIPNNPNLTTEWGGQEKQERWAKLSLLALQRCHVWLNSVDQPASLQSIYYFLADERFKIARVLAHNVDYGLPRYDDYMTSPFNATRLRTQNHFQELKERFLTMAGEAGYLEYKKTYHNEETGILTIKLSYTDTLLVDYPDLKTAKELMEEANQLWLTAYANKNELSSDEKYYQLGKILWHLAIARPLQFGSASVSEFVYYTLANQLGLPLTALDCGNKTWDIWAMIHSNVDEYAAWFSKMAQASCAVNPVFELSALTDEDHTNAIAREANKLADLALEDNFVKIPRYQTANLTDPYGFSLFHHYIMTLAKRRFANLCEFSAMEKATELAYQMTPNFEVMFLDALLRGSEIVDPVIFIFNLSNRGVELSWLKKTSDKIHVLFNTDILRRTTTLSFKGQREAIIRIYDYTIALIDNPEIHRMTINTKTMIESVSCDKFDNIDDFMLHCYHLIDDKLTHNLQILIEKEIPFNDTQLMKLIEIAEFDDYFMDFTMNDWLRPRTAGRNFLDQVFKHDNSSLLSCMCKSCKSEEDVAKLLDYLLERYHHQLGFFLPALLNTLAETDLLLSIKEWLDLHPAVNFIPVMLVEHPALRHSLSRTLPVLTEDVQKDKVNFTWDNQSAVVCVLKVQNILEKIYALDFLVKHGMDVTLPAQLDKHLIECLRDYFYFSKNIGVCRSLCQQLEPESIKKIISVNDWHPEKDSIENFCKVLNEMAATAAHNTNLFADKTSIERFRQAVTEGLAILSKDAGAKKLIELYTTHLNFLTSDVVASLNLR